MSRARWPRHTQPGDSSSARVACTDTDAAKLELARRRPQERHLLGQRLHQRQTQLGPQDGQREPREPAATADIDDLGRPVDSAGATANASGRCSATTSSIVRAPVRLIRAFHSINSSPNRNSFEARDSSSGVRHSAASASSAARAPVCTVAGPTAHVLSRRHARTGAVGRGAGPLRPRNHRRNNWDRGNNGGRRVDAPLPPRANPRWVARHASSSWSCRTSP